MARVHYTRQDVRGNIPPQLDLGSYDAADMMADLGPQRLKDLPLKGRIVFQSNALATSKPRTGGIADEILAKWNEYIEKEVEDPGRRTVDDVEADGLGLGGSYRAGPNYRPIQTRGISRPIPVRPQAVRPHSFRPHAQPVRPQPARQPVGPPVGPQPARFRAGSRGPASNIRRQSMSPPPTADFRLGPRPINPPTYDARYRNQMVTRHLSTNENISHPAPNIPGQRLPVRPAPSVPVRPAPSVTTGLATSKWNSGILVSSSSLLNLKGNTSTSSTIAPVPSIHHPSPFPPANVQPGSNYSSFNAYPFSQANAMRLQSPTISTDTSRPVSRSSSIISSSNSTVSTATTLQQQLRIAALHINSRRAARPPPEAAKNHWNSGPLKLQETEALSTLLSYENNSDSSASNRTSALKPEILSVPQSGAHHEELKLQTVPVLEPVEFQTKTVSEEEHTHTGPNSTTQKNTTIAEVPVASDSNQEPSGISSSKYASPRPSGLLQSKYATSGAFSLSSSKYATSSAPGLSGSIYATSPASGLISSRYASPTASELSSKYANSIPSNVVAPNPTGGLLSSKYAPQQVRISENKAVLHPQTKVSQLEIPELHIREEVEDVPVKMPATATKKETPEMAIKEEISDAQIEVPITEPEIYAQEPMPPPQLLVDSIAARYKFATPKQISGLARRYGTIFVDSNASLRSKISPTDREVREATRAFKALFISRGR